MKFNRRVTDRKLVGWLRRPATNLAVAILFLGVLLAIALITASAVDLSNRQSNDEHTTCVIQARGLPAGHELAVTVTDIHKLITLLLREPRSPTAPPPNPKVNALVIDLNGHAGKYALLESGLPPTRKC